MLQNLVIGSVLVALSVLIHTAGLIFSDAGRGTPAGPALVPGARLGASWGRSRRSISEQVDPDGGLTQGFAVTIHSAGILLYRRRAGGEEVFLIHPGGPYWARKEMGAWSIPKGVIGPQEDALAAARREFREETGGKLQGAAQLLGTFRLPGGKQLTIFVVEGDFDPQALSSNSFTMVWPPRSGSLRSFPEADRAGWFAHSEAIARITGGQRPILEKFYASRRPADT